jgi:hypothetical protein
VTDRPARHPRRRQARVAIGAIAALALVVAAIVGTHALRNDGNKKADITERGPIELPHLVPGVVPPGLQLDGASEGPPLGKNYGTRIRTIFYGDPKSPGSGADLALTTLSWTAWAELHPPPEGNERVTVHGHDGYGCRATSSSLCAQPLAFRSGLGLTTVGWNEATRLHVSLASHGLDLDQLVSIAHGLRSEGDSLTLGSVPAGLPGRLVEIGRADSGQVPAGVTGTPGGVGYHAWYHSSKGPREAHLTVGVSAGGDGDALAQVWASRTHRRVKVRGHQGWFGSDPATDVSDAWATLAWVEEPGVLVEVVANASHLTERDLLAVARSVRPATATEWAELTDGSPVPDGG